MGKLDVDISEIRKLVELVETYGLEELTVEEADLAVTVKGRSAQVTAPVVVQACPEPSASASLHTPEELPHEEVHAEPETRQEDNTIDIVAELVGVFYRTPAPDAPPFIEVGDEIEVGTEVGLIEAMKVFSPIPSEVAGIVVEIPAENGKLVQQGDVLVRVRAVEE